MLGVGDNILRLRFDLDATQDLFCRYAFPGIIEARPTGDAMKIAFYFHTRQFEKLLIVARPFRLHQPKNAKSPGLGMKIRHHSGVQQAEERRVGKECRSRWS